MAQLNPTETPIQLEGDALFRYRDTVEKIIVVRSQILICVGIMLMMFASFLDIVTYPDKASLFFHYRVICCFILAFMLLLTFFKFFQQYIIWITHVVLFSLGATIIYMIFLTNGAESHYYEGVNLVIIASLIMNSFYFRHALGICTTLFALYTIATLANPEHWSFQNYFFPAFFIVFTSALVLIMTRLYHREHLRAFWSHLNIEKMYSQADTLSKIDDLTQIYNRRYFIEVLNKKIEDSQNTNKAFYLVFFDIDHFKNINDTHGHSVGDCALQVVVAQVRQHIRASSEMGRYGGDEFMFFMDMNDRTTFLERLDHIRKKTENFQFSYRGKDIPLSLSFGAVYVDPTRYKDARAVIEKADQAMLDVKKNKRGGIYLVD